MNPDAAAPSARGFELDEFQRNAIEHLDAGLSVLVSAPTGSGKTLIAEHAVDSALARGLRAFYTTPVKALSNQKFHDLRDRLGARRVGLLTGDNVVNGGADAVVMTTEVLRNMIYADDLDDRLGVVVLDEVHYLEDALRGPVWEEVILHLPKTVTLVCLSATVSNHGQLGEWLNAVRGSTAVVVETRRPVPLTDLYAVGRRRSRDVELLETFTDGVPNPRGRRFDVPESLRPATRRSSRHRRRPSARARLDSSRNARARPDERGHAQVRAGSGARRGGGGRRGAQDRLPWRQPRRCDLIAELQERGLLPVIWFVFSRKGCDNAAAGLIRDGVGFTSRAEATRIDEIVAARLNGLDDEDAVALGARRWTKSLRLGIAVHHAGLIGAFKETVEQCFEEGLVKVVFATETLALGVNMPARSVVIGALTKFDGRRNAPLSPSQYTQLCGRAGRRGIDEAGCAVALWSPYTDFEHLAGLAASRAFELRSAFRPTYNMVAGLLSRMGPDSARDLLRRSFAQFQAEASAAAADAARPRGPRSQAYKPRTAAAGQPVDLVARFDALASVLRERGHLDEWTLTASGRPLARLFHEADLAVVEALRSGALAGLSPPELAAVLSAFTYEHRSKGPKPQARLASEAALAGLDCLEALLEELSDCERRFGVHLTRPLDTGFAATAYRWATGEPLARVLEEGFSPGDFVRNVKQVVELARQVAAAALDPSVARAARRTVIALDRGVVSTSGAVSPSSRGVAAPV